MKSDLPKVLHVAAGRPLVCHVLAALGSLPIDPKVVVTSNRKDEIAGAIERSGYGNGLTYAVQDPPKGTGDAVRIGLDAIGADSGTVLVLPGDAPLIQPDTIEALLHVHENGRASATVLTARISDPTGYGRVIRTATEAVLKIVEEQDASYVERTVDEINSGVYLFDVARLREALDKVDAENAQKEYYLTDTIEVLTSAGDVVIGYRTHPQEVLGVNSRTHLARVGEMLRRRACELWMDEGVTVIDPTTTYIDASVTIGRDAVIFPFTFLEGDTVIAERAEVGPHARVIDSHVGVEAQVTYSVVRESSIGREASVGPFASLRPGTNLERGAKIGTFVETKATTIGEESKVPHLTYLGDAEIGRRVNIGAGTITCNWDGKDKHKTVIDDDAYIGSDTMIVAPAHIGQRAATGAGAVVRGDVPDDSLAVGVPAKLIEGHGDKMGRGESIDDGEQQEPRQ